MLTRPRAKGQVKIEIYGGFIWQLLGAGPLTAGAGIWSWIWSCLTRNWSSVPHSSRPLSVACAVTAVAFEGSTLNAR